MYINERALPELLGRRVDYVWEIQSGHVLDSNYKPYLITWLPYCYAPLGLTWYVKRHSTYNNLSIKYEHPEQGMLKRNRHFWWTLHSVVSATHNVTHGSLWVGFPKVISVIYRCYKTERLVDYYITDFDDIERTCHSILYLDSPAKKTKAVQVKVKLNDQQCIVRA
jgi:hypothetical protein